MNCHNCGKEIDINRDGGEIGSFNKNPIFFCLDCQIKMINDSIYGKEEKHKQEMKEIEERMHKNFKFWNKIHGWTIVFGIIVVLWIYIFLFQKG